MSKWEVKRLNVMCDVISGYAFKSNDFTDKGTPVVKISNIGNGFCDINSNTQYVNPVFLEKLQNKYIISKNSILISLTGSHLTQPNSMVGRSCRYNHSFKSVLNQRAGRVIPKCSEKQGLFLYYIMQTQWMKEYIGLVAYGAANQANISPKTIEKIKIIAPDLATQQRIADILSAYDDLIENNNRRIELLEKAAQDLYKEWFVRFRFPGHENAKFKDGLPEGWEVKKIIEIADAVGGGTPSTSEKKYWDNGDIMWVTPTDITKNKNLVLIDVEKRITKLGLKNSSAKMLPPYTILMTSRASIGFFGIINKSVCTNQGFISLINKNSNYRYYTLFALINQRDVIESRATGATFKEISKSSFKEMKILVPHINVVYDYNKFTDDIFNKILELKTKNQNLKKQRDLLLPRLMSGKLEV